MGEIISKRIGNLPQLSGLSAETNIVVEEGGKAKRIPAGKAIPSGVVKSVNGTAPDESGNVQVKIPEGFSGSWNDLTEKPFGEQETLRHEFTLNAKGGNNYIDDSHEGVTRDSRIYRNTEYLVKYDGVEYRCGSKASGDDSGGSAYIGTNYPTHSDEYPFCIFYNGESGSTEVEVVDDGATHTVEVYTIVSTVTPLPEQFIPGSISRTADVDAKLAEINELPEGAAAHQMLVTDADGVAKWEDRLCYEGTAETSYLSSREVNLDLYIEGVGSYSGQVAPENYTVPDIGTSVIVTVDGETIEANVHETVYTDPYAGTEKTARYIGNLSLIAGNKAENTGEAMCVRFTETWIIFYCADEGTKVVDLSVASPVVHTIPEKFLPASVGGGSDVFRFTVCADADTTVHPQTLSSYSCDKTCAEIVEAIWAGKIVQGHMILRIASTSQVTEVISFSRLLLSASPENLNTAHLYCYYPFNASTNGVIVIHGNGTFQNTEEL